MARVVSAGRDRDCHLRVFVDLFVVMPVLDPRQASQRVRVLPKWQRVTGHPSKWRSQQPDGAAGWGRPPDEPHLGAGARRRASYRLPWQLWVSEVTELPKLFRRARILEEGLVSAKDMQLASPKQVDRGTNALHQLTQLALVVRRHGLARGLGMTPQIRWRPPSEGTAAGH